MSSVNNVHIKHWNKTEKASVLSATRGSKIHETSGLKVQYQSSFERDFVDICRFAKEVQSIRWEPFTLNYHDLIDDKPRTYTPDYLVEIETTPGARRHLLVEVKRMRALQRVQGQSVPTIQSRALLAGDIWAQQQPNAKMFIVTDTWMKNIGLKNIKLILRSVIQQPDFAIRRCISQQFINHDCRTLSEINQLCIERGHDHQLIVPMLMEMCWRDEINFDVSLPLSKETRFYVDHRHQIFD